MSKVRRIVIALSMVVMCLTHTSAFAETKISFSNPNVWASGMKVDVSSGSDVENISLEASQDYDINTTYIFNTKPSFAESTSALKVHISQKSTDDLWMDFILEDANKNKKSLSVDGAVVLHRDNSDASEIVKLDDVSLDLGTEFSGDIYIPFRCLKIDKSGTYEDKFNMKNLNSAGFTFSLKGNATSKIEIGSMNSLTDKEDPYLESKFDAKIVGEDALPIPATAETISQYSIEGSQKDDFTFVPVSGASGAAVTENGVFKISQYASEQGMSIRAKNKEGLYISKNIKIYKSWLSTQDNQRLKIPLPNEIEPTKNNYSVLENMQIIDIARVGCLIAVLVFGVCYFISSKRFKG